MSPLLQVWNPSLSEGTASLLGNCLTSSAVAGFKFEFPAFSGISFVEESRKAYPLLIVATWLCSFSLPLATAAASLSLSLCISPIRSLCYSD